MVAKRKHSRLPAEDALTLRAGIIAYSASALMPAAQVAKASYRSRKVSIWISVQEMGTLHTPGLGVEVVGGLFMALIECDGV